MTEATYQIVGTLYAIGIVLVLIVSWWYAFMRERAE